MHEIPAIVAMAVYEKDCADWIDQAIGSIRQQSYSDFLYVIVIDGHISPELLA
ncbi:MAG TPA: glycosyl transferase, partial [Alteromonas sp.]|nr:glycosyl transferase [Alteromonas sp.]